VKSTRSAILLSLALALAVGWFVAGHYFYKAPIGLDGSAFFLGDAIHATLKTLSPTINGSAVAVVWLVLSLIGVGVLAAVLVRRAARAGADGADPGRRGFLAVGIGLGATLVAGGVAFARAILGLGNPGSRGWGGVNSHIQADVVKTHPQWPDHWKGARVESYRRLGRTGWEVSDIVLGTGPLSGDVGVEIVRSGLDRGVNYIDTSPDYSAAGSEQIVGKGIRDFPRDELFLATKFCTPTGHLPPGTPVAKYVEAVEASLGRLGTDYVDLCHIHSCDEIDRLMDENVHEAFDRLKESGKVRFLGFSTHTPRLIEVANRGIDSGRFDVMMLAYHYGMWAPMGEIISRGRREQDMGVVAMKTLKGGKHHGLAGFQEEADSFAQGALKWTLSNPEVSCAVISFFKLQHLDEYLSASGKSLDARDLAVLRRYDREIVGSYCQPHCGKCLGTCPEGLPIHDVLRHRMYFEDYGLEKEAMRLYSRLPVKASVCAGCSAPCLGSCPAGIAIPERAQEAHRLLTLG
jgi:predicted aldo/keto reductase-like oxidoreductase